MRRYNMLYMAKVIKKLSSDPDGRFSRAMDDYAKADFYNDEADDKLETAKNFVS